MNAVIPASAPLVRKNVTSMYEQIARQLRNDDQDGGSCSAWPVSMGTRAWGAAAPAWATVSGMSLGPWQQPARKMPSVKVLTGASLGWRSRKKP